MGDKALRLVADTLKGNLHGDTDFLARYGGEEFVIVLNNTSPLEAESVANNLISSIKSLNIAHKTSDISDRITISIGSHTFVAADLTEYSSLFEQADKALYLAKKLGRDRVCSSISLDQFK
jgi:diguanylate cyclase (GGDEF)-like protein